MICIQYRQQIKHLKKNGLFDHSLYVHAEINSYIKCFVVFSQSSCWKGCTWRHWVCLFQRQQRHRQPDGRTRQETRASPRLLFMSGTTMLQAPLPFFHQWKQVITSYPFTSLMGFSAMLRSAVMEHPLMKIHMAGCLKISAIHSSRSFFLFLFFLRNHWKIRQGFSTRCAKILCINDICRYGILSRISSSWINCSLT